MANAISITVLLALVAILPLEAASRSKQRCQNQNETYTPCVSPCPITCANKDQEPIKCPAVCKKEGGCVCKSGYIQGWNQNCIKPEDCPTCNGPNEFFSCGSACDTTCETLGEECPIVNVKCNEKCYCKDGFARDSEGICIPTNDCPSRQCKDDPNAITTPCGDPCPRTCENKDDNGSRPCIEICIINGCKCKEGFVKGSDGKCIPVESCPATKKCGKNEIYDTCPPLCPPEDTCQSYVSGVVYRCAPTTKCVPACRCKEGFIRNVKNGKCINPDVCCGDPNSKMVSCPNPCPGGTCEKPEFAPCRMGCRIRGCQCSEGFVKKSATDATCVAIEDCDSSSHQ